MSKGSNCWKSMCTLGGRHALDLVVRLATVCSSLGRDHGALRGSHEEGERHGVEGEELGSEGGHGVWVG